MKHPVSHNHPPYPGHYVPPTRDEMNLNSSKEVPAGLWKRLPVDVLESEAEIRIDISLPGLKREDIEISAESGILTILDVRPAKASGRSALRAPACFFKQIQLPETADPEFASAQYIDGVLHMVLAKSRNAISCPDCAIVVY